MPYKEDNLVLMSSRGTLQMTNDNGGLEIYIYENVIKQKTRI